MQQIAEILFVVHDNLRRCHTLIKISSQIYFTRKIRELLTRPAMGDTGWKTTRHKIGTYTNKHNWSHLLIAQNQFYSQLLLTVAIVFRMRVFCRHQSRHVKCRFVMSITSFMTIGCYTVSTPEPIRRVWMPFNSFFFFLFIDVHWACKCLFADVWTDYTRSFEFHMIDGKTHIRNVLATVNENGK